MPDTRIEGTVPEEAGMRSSPLESRLAALEQRANTLLANLEKERQAVETEKQERKPEDKPTTVGEVQAALDKLMASIAIAMNRVANSVDGKIRDIGNIYATQDQAKQFAKDAVPIALQDLDAASSSSGEVLMRQPGGAGGSDSAYWGTVKTAAGTPFPWDKVDKGFLINPDHDDSTTKVRIYAGEIDRIATAQTDITVANNDFAYVRRAIADDTMLVANGATVPDDDDTYKYYKLYQFVVAGGAAQVLKYFRPFAIEGGEGGAGLPSNANKSKWMVLTMSDDNATENDNPALWVVDWTRAHL